MILGNKAFQCKCYGETLPKLGCAKHEHVNILILNFLLEVFYGPLMWLKQIQRMAELAQIQYKHHPLFVIAIDGCGGAGKSTLCQVLKQEIEPWAHTQVLKLDDFYCPLTKLQQQNLHNNHARDAYFNATEFKDNILQPLSKGIKASYKPVHWLDGQSDECIELLPKGVLIIDGVFSFSEALRDMIHLSLFVETPTLLRKQRMLARPQQDVGWVDHWQSTESWHHQHESTADEVECVVRGDQA